MDLNSKGPLILLTHYQSSAKLRRAGHKRIAAYLRSRGVKGSKSVAHKALTAAKAQSVILPAQEVRKRAEGKRHTQALIALARRRVNVVWAMLRDECKFESRSAA